MKPKIIFIIIGIFIIFVAAFFIFSNHPPESLPKKAEQVQKGMEKWVSEGRDPSQVSAILQEIDPLMKTGKYKEAEEILDKALAMLESEKEIDIDENFTQTNSQFPTFKSDEIQYLIFQLFTYAPSPEGITQPFDGKDIRKNIDDILEAVGNNKGDGKTRQLGVSIGPLALDHTDEELRTMIRESFQIAEEKNVAVAFHIDDSMFWINRKDLWSDPKNVEWTDWDGTIHPQRYVGWINIKLAPQMCYSSPTLRAVIKHIAKDVIGAEIKKGIDGLSRSHKEHLFAGVIAGWETHLADPSYIGKTDDAANNLKIVRKRIGYCSLTNSGYGASNPPDDFDKALEEVLNNWIDLWTNSLFLSGIPKDRIYSHIAFPPKEMFTTSFIGQIKEQTGLDDFSYSAMVGHAMPYVGFTANARAGFSVYPSLLKANGTEATFANIYNELERQGNQHWALAEGTNTAVGSGAVGISWEQYLTNFFAHGASLVNIFAWQEPIDSGGPYGKATKSKEAVEAYRKFLSGQL